MARAKKTWREKLAAAKAKPGLPKAWFCKKAKQTLVVPSPDEVEAIIRRVRRGRLITMGQVGDLLRKAHGADVACPMTTGIFASLIAHAAEEEEQAGRRRVPPWWRLLKAGGELNPKYPGRGQTQRARLLAEGHRVVRKGKKLVVADYDRSLVGHMKPTASPRLTAKPGRPMRRKVLLRDDFGLCVLLPKTCWSALPATGRATVRVNGTKRRVTVRSEQCTCRGRVPHEHRFVSLPASAGLKAHEVLTLDLT